MQGDDAKYRAIIDTAVDAIAVIDEHGIVQSFNGAAEKIFLYPADEVVGRNVSMLMPEPDHSQHDRYIANYRTTGQAKIIGVGREVRGRRRDGSIFPLDLSIAEWRADGRRYFTGIMRDVTERKLAEAQRQTDEAKYRAIIDTAVDAIAVIDEHGVVQSFNRAAEKIFLYAADEVVGRNVSMLMPEPDLSRHDQYLADYRSTGQAKIIGVGREVQGRRRDGSIFPLDLSIAEWRAEGRRYFTGIMRDATERKLGEEALRRLTETLEQRVIERTRALELANQRLTEQMESLRRAQAALQQAQKMEAVGQLTGGIAHDFNNLLTAIAGNLDLISEATKGEQSLQPLIDTAQRAAERGTRLTAQLLAFSRQQALRPEVVDLNVLVQEFRLLVARAVGEAVEIDFRPDPVLWPSLVDPAQLQSAVLNLAVNARDAMPGGGILVIETRNIRIGEAEAAMAEASPGQHVMLAVSDAGMGMATETVARAFEPFFTTKEIGKGTGLGLSQVYGFARQSGGYATIESVLGHGTTVRVYLPRSEIAIPATIVKSPQAERPGSGETILVVEDDPNVLDTVVNMLGSLGYRTIVAANGREALAILERGGTIDLLFTDIVMPGGINGFDLAREAGRQYPSLKVLLTTGYAAVHRDPEMVPTTEFAILDKPFLRVDLAAKIHEVLAPRPAAQP